jgi:hypothetical protein
MNLVANLALAVVLLQTRRQANPRLTSPNISGANTDAIATFAGTFKSSDKKYVVIQVENDQTMRMYITGSTKFIHDGKPAKASDFHIGESVSVDASRDSRLNLLAVKVENVKPDASESNEPAKDPAKDPAN